MHRSTQPPSRWRRGWINKPVAALLASIVVVAALVTMLATGQNADRAKTSLLVYCAAGLKGPLEEIAANYECREGVRLELQFGGSQTLLTTLELTRTGDLFLSADEQYLVEGGRRGLLRERRTIAMQHPVLAVRKGNPLAIDSLASLLEGPAKISLANPDMAAIGAIARQALTKSGDWQRLVERTTVLKPTVNDVANDIKVGAADAGIVWDQTVHLYRNDLEAVSLPELADARGTVGVGLLTSSEHVDQARRLVRYLASAEGAKVFARYGFSPAQESAP